jgi:hypothetical protein
VRFFFSLLILLTLQGDWEDTESDNGSRPRHESGGIDLSDHFKRTVSINGSVPDTLIDSEFSYTAVNEVNPGTWSEVAGTKSWHTGSATAPSTGSGFDPNRYGNPTTRSVASSQHSYSSSIVERSQSGTEQVEMRNGFARIKAYVSTHLVLMVTLAS